MSSLLFIIIIWATGGWSAGFLGFPAFFAGAASDMMIELYCVHSPQVINQARPGLDSIYERHATEREGARSVEISNRKQNYFFDTGNTISGNRKQNSCLRIFLMWLAGWEYPYLHNDLSCIPVKSVAPWSVRNLRSYLFNCGKGFEHLSNIVIESCRKDMKDVLKVDLKVIKEILKSG